jgi:hypothetical protein
MRSGATATTGSAGEGGDSHTRGRAVGPGAYCCTGTAAPHMRGQSSVRQALSNKPGDGQRPPGPFIDSKQRDWPSVLYPTSRRDRYGTRCNKHWRKRLNAPQARMLVTHAENLFALQAQYVSPTWPSARFNCSFDEQKLKSGTRALGFQRSAVSVKTATKI